MHSALKRQKDTLQKNTLKFKSIFLRIEEADKVKVGIIFNLI